ncbi:hypothetical protein [Novosphingobium sp.]|uniref:hypothetical protein n=1 Tax=Novosphingobium sp. TaxID=1874826 RepID=UPI0035ADF81C
MNLNTVLSHTRSAFAGRTKTHATAAAFTGMHMAPDRSATLSREEFRKAVLEVLG